MTWLISEAQTRQLINMRQALKVVEQLFRDRALGKVSILPRRRLRGTSRQLNVMAGWQSSPEIFCLRAYMGASNTITLYDGRAGKMLAILNARYLSSLRTGAASGVAAKYLAPPEAKIVGLIGPGRQARFQLEAIAGSCSVERVIVYGRDQKKTNAFVRSLSREIPAPLTGSSSLRDVEAQADILVVATDSSEPVTDGRDLKENVLVVTMGANQAVKHEVSTNLIRQMDLVVTDDLAAAQADSGDLIAACNAGVIRWENVVPLEKIVANGLKADRLKKILFQSNGIPDEDLAVALFVVNQIRRKKGKAKKVTEI